jgi:nicotinamide mononucleotide transporter
MADATSITTQIMEGLRATGPVEYVAVTAGIAAVFLERAENIWLYPVGLINTILYIYLSLNGHLYGEASVNLFYTIISVYGWVLWARRNSSNQPELQITYSSAAEWRWQLSFFTGCYLALFIALSWLKKYFPGALPGVDAFAAASAYTAMLMMARKKVETWYWWLATNIVSIPLYFVKGYAFSSVQFMVFTILSVLGLIAWRKKAKAYREQAF